LRRQNLVYLAPRISTGNLIAIQKGTLGFLLCSLPTPSISYAKPCTSSWKMRPAGTLSKAIPKDILIMRPQLLVDLPVSDLVSLSTLVSPKDTLGATGLWEGIFLCEHGFSVVLNFDYQA
jgi:hypothetical protein